MPGAYLDPNSQTVHSGDFFAIDVVAANVSDVGAYEFIMTFDPAIMTIAGVSNGSFLGSTDRPVFCPPPTIGESLLRFGCVTSGTNAGASGSGLLAEVVFQAATPGTGNVQFPLMELADPLGRTVDVGVDHGTVTVSPPGSASSPNVPQPYLVLTAMLTGAAGLLVPSVGLRGRARGRLYKAAERGNRAVRSMKSFIRKMMR